MQQTDGGPPVSVIVRTGWTAAEPRDGFLSDARPFGRTRLIEVAARYVAGRRVRRRR